MIPDNPYFWRFPDTADSNPATADGADSGGVSQDGLWLDKTIQEGFTNPFRYVPNELVLRAGKLVAERLGEWAAMPENSPQHVVERSFAEGKMLGVLVCAASDSENSSSESNLNSGNGQIIFIAGFSGTIKGADGLATCTVDGFVPPVIDLTCPDGYFKKEESVISGLNREIETLISSDKYTYLKSELITAGRDRDSEIERLQAEIRLARMQRDEIRSEVDDPAKLEVLIKESQFQKAELKRAKDRWKEKIAWIGKEISEIENNINQLKSLRSSKSDALQKWIFENAIVHNADGESLSIWEIFTKDGLIPPGGTGDCAAPKLLNYAYKHGLKPLAMGEFWYGKSPDTAVRTHGHFYPSCTSKCGPLLGFMLKGLGICSEDDMLCRSAEQEQSIEISKCAPTEANHSVADSNCPPTEANHSVADYNCAPTEANHSVADSNCAPTTELKHIYEDESIIIIEKPGGMPSVPGLDGRISALEILGNGYHAVHRLDMDTSGVMIFAKTHEAAVDLRRQFEEHTIRKTYKARICKPDSESHPKTQEITKTGADESQPMTLKGNVSLPLSADYDERPRQKVDFIQGKPAHTDYELLRNNPDGTSDILLYPRTGRTHQLRVHCAHTLGLGRPILGDLLYGAYSVDDVAGNAQFSQAAISGDTNIGHSAISRDAHPCLGATHSHANRLCLHAQSITFCHPATGEQMTFTSDTLSY